MVKQLRRILVFAAGVLAALSVYGDEHVPAQNELVVTYAAEFFGRYQPNTALDMVRQVPGFQLDDGDDQRGFGGAVGNVLINDRYPSAKQDTPSQILLRMPASQVERIELIRGQIREIDLLGKPVVVNVVLVQDSSAAIRWELGVRKNFSLSPLAPNVGMSMSDQWRGMTYNFGIDGRRASFGDPGTRDIYDSGGIPTERRFEDHEGSGFNANSYFTASREFGRTLLNFNSTLGFEYRDEDLDTAIVAEDPAIAPTNDRLTRERRNRKIEIGFDVERDLSPELAAKAILLHFELDQRPLSVQRRFDGAGDETLFREADTDAKETEDIVRLEFVWTQFENHVLQLNVEGARNVLDRELVQTVDSGMGPEVVPVPGANSRVEETRGDILINDTWTFGRYKFDYGVGAETSTISQTGDAEQKRSFSFIKPRTALTYSASPSRQTRFSLAREVSQLDFNDFVSATVFEDDDLALGNPNLQPESTWVAEFSEEWRFGELGVVKVSAFHHWISDVEDLLPLSAEFEAPGNIGDGRRWGVILESTLPLERIGLTGAKLDVKARWQDSTVPDPVTDRDRVLSSEGGSNDDVIFLNENRYAFILDFRQDLDTARVAWGWHYGVRAERPVFKVNELEIFDEGIGVTAFIETTRWLGVKISLTGVNLTDNVDTRDRTVFAGERDLSPVAFREYRRLTNGRRIVLGFSGAF